MRTTPYAQLPAATKTRQRRWQRARQRALVDLQRLHPGEYEALLEERLAEEGVQRLTQRQPLLSAARTKEELA